MAAEPDNNPPTRIPLRVEEMLVAAAMAAMALITGANVLTRYLSNVSIGFTEEYSVVLMVIVTLLGTAIATASGRHIRIAYFLDLLPQSAHRRGEMVAMACTMLCFGLLVLHGGRLAYDEYRYEVMSSGLGNPSWWYTGWLPLLSLVVVLRAAGRFIRLWRGLDG